MLEASWIINLMSHNLWLLWLITLSSADSTSILAILLRVEHERINIKRLGPPQEAHLDDLRFFE